MAARFGLHATQVDFIFPKWCLPIRLTDSANTDHRHESIAMRVADDAPSLDPDISSVDRLVEEVAMIHVVAICFG